jgi:transcriptional regulator with XRE-family HTH domain
MILWAREPLHPCVAVSDLEPPYEPYDGTLTPSDRADGIDTWAGDVTRAVAAEVRRWRERRGLSAQQLSDKTRDLGFHVPRSVIANLETNRRDTIGVAEILILAAALDVPPIQLITPVGLKEKLGTLPGLSLSAWEARGWIIGAILPRYHSRSLTNWQDGRRAIVLYDIHRLLVREHQQIETRISKLAAQSPDGASGDNLVERSTSEQIRSVLSDALDELAMSLNRISAHRELIRSEGMLPPELPLELALRLREK